MLTATALLCLLATSPAGPLELEPGDLKPGLIAEFRSLVEKDVTVTRIEKKPAFYLGRSSPHPRIPPGSYEVTYSGVIAMKDSGAITFSAFVGGEVTITIDGAVVLEGKGLTDTARIVGKPTKRDTGSYTFIVKYRSVQDVPARLQIWWEGDAFAREPLPAWRLGHRDVDLSDRGFIEWAPEGGRSTIGQFGCARCHQSAFPGLKNPPPGPSLADSNRRLSKAWVMKWLAAPAKLHPDTHMPELFKDDRIGYVERWIIAESLAEGAAKRTDAPEGDHRRGRITFLSVGCAACHVVPDIDRKEQKYLGQIEFVGLGDRMNRSDIVAFLGNPHNRYPDGRMPRLPVTPAEARDIAAYLLLWSKPSERPAVEAPKPEELQAAFKRIGARDVTSSAAVFLKDKGCTACHTGLGESRPRDIPLKEPKGWGCSGVNYPLGEPPHDGRGVVRKFAGLYAKIASQDKHPSPYFERQQRLAQAGCVRCHQRDTDKPAAIEEIGSTLGGAPCKSCRS
ncbi:MAG: hypothetical protein U0792_05875 [Gemmataceae bacterium]